MSGWRTSFQRTSFVVQTKILYCKTTITHTISFWRQQLSQLVRKLASQNKAKNAGRSGKNAGRSGKNAGRSGKNAGRSGKNAGRSGKNAGMRERRQNVGFPARLRDG